MQNKYFTVDDNTIKLKSNWDLENLIAIKKDCSSLNNSLQSTITIDGTDLGLLDSAGAWWLNVCFKTQVQGKITLKNFSEAHQQLITITDKNLESTSLPPTQSLLTLIGKKVVGGLDTSCRFLHLVGELSYEFLWMLRRPHKIRFSQIFKIIETSGFQALGIIALLSMMIGIVMTYQMGLQLRTYGANIFIVDLLGLGILREFAPLITAIMVAGRTGSAFAAQLGTMKLNQEIDALSTMGIKPNSLLLLPRILGLMIALPLLTFWSDIFGILGGMVIAHSMLDIPWHDFLARFQHVVSLRSLVIGLAKAPVFALVIGTIGCFSGMQVVGSADSVGKQTTKSVVLSIFYILIIDALFSVVLSELKL